MGSSLRLAVGDETECMRLEDDDSLVTSNYVDSLTPVNRLLTRGKYSKIFNKPGFSFNENESDDLIDVVGDSNPILNTKLGLKEKIDTNSQEVLLQRVNTFAHENEDMQEKFSGVLSPKFQEIF